MAKENLEIRLVNLISSVGNLIHNGVNSTYSCISEIDMRELGKMLKEIKDENGINIKILLKTEKFIKNINEEFDDIA